MDNQIHHQFDEAVKKLFTSFDIHFENSPEEEEEDRKLRHEGDYGRIIAKAREKLDDLNEKILVLLEKTGQTRESLDQFMHNPNNFSSEQWQALQEFNTILGKIQSNVRAIATPVSDQKQPPQKKKPSKGFVKRKDWKSL